MESVGIWIQMNSMANSGAKVVFHYRAVSTNSTFEFTSQDFVCDRTKDRTYTLEKDCAFSDDIVIPSGSMIRVGATGQYDWSYIQTAQKSGLIAARTESVNLLQGTPLFVLGYPSGRGEGNPILSEARCAQNGLDDDGTIMASNDNTEGGNSGGPIFIMGDSGALVVGIVSGSTYSKGRFVPIRVIP